MNVPDLWNASPGSSQFVVLTNEPINHLRELQANTTQTNTSWGRWRGGAVRGGGKFDKIIVYIYLELRVKYNCS